MSTTNSPANGFRSQKIDGGRVRCVVYLPKQELEEIQKISNATGASQSNVIAQFYFQGKNANEKQED